MLPAWGRDKWPSAIVIPKTQPDTQALQRMIWTLQHGQVEIRESTAPMTIDGKTYPAGSYVVLTKQPFGAYAKALLERQQYPDLFDYPGGPPKRPYDVTAHTLPLLFGVDVAHVMGAAPATGAVIKEIAGADVHVGAEREVDEAHRAVPSEHERADRRRLDALDSRHVQDSVHDRSPRRIVAAGALNDRFDVIVFPEGGTRRWRRRWRAVAEAAVARRRRRRRGGRVRRARRVRATTAATCWRSTAASNAMIEGLKLPVKNVLAGVSNNDFYAPGSILARGDQARSARLRAASRRLFRRSGSRTARHSRSLIPRQATAVATYPASGNPLLSGWLLGGSKLNGKAALVDVKRGKGHVVLYGFRPQYRGQSMATYPLIWSAIGQ